MSVSIIIPTYNRAAFLKNALNSVYRQTYQDFEVIVIDDGSTDNTEEVAKSFKGIIYIKQENSGLNASRNRAIKLAKGEFIALLDDDDWWMDFKLKLQVNILKKIPNTSFVYSDFIINKPSGTNINSGLSTWYEEENWKDIFDQNIELSSSDISITPGKKVRNIYIGDLYHPSLFDPYVLPATALIRRSSIPPGLTFTENDSTCGDWEYFARLSHHMPAAYIDMETAYNRSHESPTRLTRINKSVQLTRRINMIERVWESDTVFNDIHKNVISNLKSNLQYKLILTFILENKAMDAKNVLNTIKETMKKPLLKKYLPLWLAIHIPGGIRLIYSIRTLKRMLS